MVKTKRYSLVKFPPELLQEAVDILSRELSPSNEVLSLQCRVHHAKESWGLDNLPELFAEYRKDVDSAYLTYILVTKGPGARQTAVLDFHYRGPTSTTVEVHLQTREGIERVFEAFERNYERFRLRPQDQLRAIQERVSIFIGHGRSDQWRELKDHLQDKHQFKVIAYETGARAGHTISEVLDEMVEDASFALLVLTGEDEGRDGVVRARENVIHETGLFQGALGRRRAIVLLEEGCSEFSNIQGLQELRFSKGRIREIFGDVVATIYREFGAEGEAEGEE